MRKAADEIINNDWFKSFETKKINELVVTSNILKNNVTGLITSGLGPDVALSHQLDNVAFDNACEHKPMAYRF
jgi:hypothetical protein